MAATKVRLSGQGNLEADLAANSHKITGLLDPTNPQDAATKAYTDAVAAGIDWHGSVRAVSTTNLTLSAPQTVDGVALIAGDRILVAGQTAGQDNGIYTVAAGAWSRSTDAATSGTLNAGAATFVEEGTVNADSGWVLTTNNPITLGTTVQTWSVFSGISSLVAGNGLTKTGSTVDFVSTDTSITVVADSAKVNLTLWVPKETPAGLVNGANTAFTIANPLVAGTEHVYLNGMLHESGAGNDYTISGTAITYLTAPLTGDRIRVTYIKTP